MGEMLLLESGGDGVVWDIDMDIDEREKRERRYEREKKSEWH